MSTSETPNPEQHVLGERLHRFRKRSGWSLRDLAERAEVSVGYISQVERGKAEPSIAVLRRLAAALGIDWIDLYQAEEISGQLVRRAERPHFSLSTGQEHYAITRSPMSDVEVGVVEYSPGTTAGGDDYTHGDVHEVLVILRGELEFTLDGVSHQMHEGDSIEFRSSRPHMIRNVSDEVAEALWISNPPAGLAR
ncbi:helix-turn-helix domain-containing protein [Microbacterium sp. 179-I 3D3 NHS]|uniref:helix-turn-helix domain-containing protein n=1 Tax=unclassified Microbacterium TaxID=2609290 RepID=UPI0039A17FE1